MVWSHIGNVMFCSDCRMDSSAPTLQREPHLRRKKDLTCEQAAIESLIQTDSPLSQ